jgi:two-component system, NtrC family, response regulator GlrR
MEQAIQRICKAYVLEKLVGESPIFVHAIAQLHIVAQCDAAVIISGQTGTGKELVARAIHYISRRAAYPFVPINCGALPDTLLEDELFGHERGAFTDAHARRPGLIAQAEKGTLFLDEIDALSMKAQVALLRVLQDKRYRAVGAKVEQQADVRIVAATNTALEQLVRAGTFRSDLYYRLGIFSFNLPSLRERKEDVPLLVRHFLQKHTPPEQTIPQITPQALDALLAYDWPGNVRELENAIIRGVYLSQGSPIDASHLGLRFPAEPRTPDAELTEANWPLFKIKKQEVIEAFERDYLTRLMQKYQGNVSQAARSAGKERRDLGKLLKKYHLDPRYFHPSPPTSSQ